MKTRIALILALLLAAGTTVRAATNDVLTVAVFDFESKDESVSGLGPKVATLVNANLSAEPQLSRWNARNWKKSWANRSWACPEPLIPTAQQKSAN